MDTVTLGRRLREARRACGLSLAQLSERTGLSLRFLSEVERGKSGASVGRVLRVAEAVGLDLTTRRLPVPRVEVARFPQLARLVWSRPGVKQLDEDEAFALYEANWRFVDEARLTARERALIHQLTQRYGRGVLHVRA